MTTAAQNQINFKPVAPFCIDAKATFNAKVLYCENGPHKAGKRVELNMGENLLELVAK